MGLREEMVGHCTLAVMSLVGLALYTGTYSLMYASVSEPVVALLEMWMTSVHTFSACGCCILQGMLVGVFKQHEEAVPHLGEMQTALFLGVACTVTLLGHECISGGDCAAYYGAAGFPRAAAVGSVAWAWILYACSLGCQTWDQGVSLGLNNREGLLVVGIMAMVPVAVTEKLKRTCGWINACTLCDSVTPMLLVFGGTLLCHGGDLWIAKQYARAVGRGLSLMGGLMVLCAAFFVPGMSYMITMLVFGLNALVQDVRYAWQPATDGIHFSLSSIKLSGKSLLHKL